MAGVVCS